MAKVQNFKEKGESLRITGFILPPQKIFKQRLTFGNWRVKQTLAAVAETDKRDKEKEGRRSARPEVPSGAFT